MFSPKVYGETNLYSLCLDYSVVFKKGDQIRVNLRVNNR